MALKERDMGQEFDAERFAAEAAAALGLPIASGDMPGVAHNLERIASLARQVMAFELPEETEPAPVFRP
jgi:hypothetical protein